MSYKPPREAAQANLAIDRAAREAGRDPREIRRIYNVQGAFTSATQGPAADTDQGIVGPPEHWAEVLTHLALDIGFGTFVLATPPDAAYADHLHRGRRPAGARARGRAARLLAPACHTLGAGRVSSLPAFEETPETNRGRMAVPDAARGPRAASAASSPASSASRQLSSTGLSVDGLNQELEGTEKQRHALAVPGQLPALLPLRPLAPSRRRHGLLRRAGGDEPGARDRSSSGYEPSTERSHDHLDAVEAAARALTDNDSVDARRAVADALEALEEHLLAHLEYEERSIAATARRLRDLPFSNQVADSDRPAKEDHQ